MTNLHDARVEAAARALFHDPLASGDYTWEEMVAEDNSRAELWRDDARRVLAAADAVLTVDAREHLHAKCDCVPDLGPAHCHLCSNERGAPVPWPECSAVAPVVTVEMIAEVLRRHQDSTPGDLCRCGWVATIGDSSHARHQAFKLIALLRGGGRR